MTVAQPGRQKGADMEGILGRGKQGERGEGELACLLRGAGIGVFFP